MSIPVLTGLMNYATLNKSLDYYSLSGKANGIFQ